MRSFFEKIPLPMSGLVLGMFALGNLLQSHSEGLRYGIGIVAGLFMLLLIVKFILFPKALLENLKNPVMASIAATFPMALMLASAYVKPFVGQLAFVIWCIGIALHIVLILYFTLQFILKIDMTKVFASYFIVYVGIVAASVTAPAFAMERLGTIFVWFGIITLIALLLLVTKRYLTHKDIPAPLKPISVIYAAPASLCVAGYIQSVAQKNTTLLWALYLLACVLYIVGLVQALRTMKNGFFPSFSAYTFPFVISAIASKQLMAFLANQGTPAAWLGPVVLIQTVIAVFFVTYVLGRYIQFLMKTEPKQA